MPGAVLEARADWADTPLQPLPPFWARGRSRATLSALMMLPSSLQVQ